ncbi:MAG: exodeoxyribonuclease VII large subunit [Azospirillum brasilense]|nr:MAG: exodeoxyribonuclease VII large subunit [Azospirillum brasilense]
MDFQHNQPEYSVSEIAGRIKRVVEDNFGHVRIRGEISKASINQASGHCYLTLKDEKAVLDAVCWKGTVAKLKHRPEAGMEVIATGKLTTYPGSSKYQLVIESMEPAGVGALMAMLEQRKQQLAAEGLFAAERKQPIPFLPTTIGVITSPTGAVIRDMLHRLGDRFPRHVLLWPVAVQGQGAAEQVAAAIEGFNALPARSVDRASHEPAEAARSIAQDVRSAEQPLYRPDVIIVARGGGSIEDLWAFNEEVVVRAVAASAIPVISAVGHETDTTLIDYAADKRAPTPTGAAEFAVPVRSELLSLVEVLDARQRRAVRTMLQHAGERVVALARGLPRPQQLVASMEQGLDGLSERLQHALQRGLQHKQERVQHYGRALSPRFIVLTMQRHAQHIGSLQERAGAAISRVVERRESQLERQGAMLQSLNVLAVMQRGFALVKTAEGTIAKSAARLSDGQSITLQFHDGTRDAVVGNGAPQAVAAPRKPRSKATASDQQGGLFD